MRLQLIHVFAELIATLSSSLAYGQSTQPAAPSSQPRPPDGRRFLFSAAGDIHLYRRSIRAPV